MISSMCVMPIQSFQVNQQKYCQDKPVKFLDSVSTDGLTANAHHSMDTQVFFSVGQNPSVLSEHLKMKFRNQRCQPLHCFYSSILHF